MRLICLMIFVSAAFAAGARAQSPGTTVTFTQFDDPTEHAFAVGVPQGWTAQAGVMRVTPVEPVAWFTAASPDGAVQVFFGDPALPLFVSPDATRPEGTTVAAGALSPHLALHYMSGADFATMYGTHNLSHSCDGVTATGSAPLPDFAQVVAARRAQINAKVGPGLAMNAPIDGGIATFTCSINGQPMVGAVLAATSVILKAAPSQQVRPLPGMPSVAPPPQDLWNAQVAGYLAPREQQKLAYAVLTQMVSGMQFNPQWDDAAVSAAKNAIGQMQADAQRTSELLMEGAREFSQTMFQMGQDWQRGMNERHDMFMQQMRSQSDQWNRQFRENMAQKDWQTYQMRLYLLDRKLVCNDYGCAEISTR